jgi:hypothetical protein
MAGPVAPGEKAWRAFEAHQRECGTCHDLRSFKKLEPVETCASSLPDELCPKGRGLIRVWLEGAAR